MLTAQILDDKTNIDDCFIIAKRFALNRFWRTEDDGRLAR